MAAANITTDARPLWLNMGPKESQSEPYRGISTAPVNPLRKFVDETGEMADGPHELKREKGGMPPWRHAS